MGRFENSRKEKGSFSKRDNRGRNNFNDSPKPRRDSRSNHFTRKDSGREFRRDRPQLEMTKVTCSSCGNKCEVPFRPTSSKPVYCKECFDKKNNKSSDSPSSKNLEIINEKLDKIMKALKIK